MPDGLRSVLMTTDAVGGVWSFSIALANELTNLGVNVSLAVLGPAPSRSQRRQALGIRNLSLYECNEDLEWMDDPWAGVKRSGEYLVGLAKRLSPQLVHLGGYAHASLPFACPKLVTAHSCVLSWWEAVKREPVPPRYDEYRRAVNAGLLQADEIVAPTSAMLAALRRIYGLRKGVVIPNGIAPTHRNTAVKERFAFCAGRVWDEGKNVRAVLDVAQRLSIPVYVAGQGSEQLERVIPLGMLGAQELRGWLEKAAIYVAPAYYEPFGLGILEAATCGAALVLSNIDSLREIWADAALYVAPDDTEGLRNAIERLAGDVQLRESMAARAVCRAQHYCVRRQARSYFDLYKLLLRRHHAVRAPAHRYSIAHSQQRGWKPCGL